MFPATYIPRVLIPAIGRRDPAPSWRVPAVISWSGMRGVVTLAAAFAIPETVPGRETIVFLAFFVTVATLLLHGLTLPTVIRKLGVREDGFQADVLAEAQTQFDAVQASISRLDELTAESDTYLAATRPRSCGGWPSTAPTRCGSGWAGPRRRPGRARARPTGGCAGRCSTASGTTFVARRDSGDIDDEVLRRVLRRLDFEEATLARDDA